jgi:cytochrome c oxidase subunit 2
VDVNFELFPEQASTVAPQVDRVFLYILGVDLFFTLLVAGLIFYFAVRYRRRREDYFPTPVVGSLALESLWTFIPLALAISMFVWATNVYFRIVRPPDEALEIYVVGRQWMWHVQHPGGQREINALHVPVDTPVRLIMTSEDVIHDFAMPAFRTKQDVVPGRYNFTWFQATRPGRYHLFCAQYCGQEHSKMVGWITVLEQADYEAWLAGERADQSLALEGQKLFRKLQCITCHSGTADARAPVLEELYGKLVQLEGGKTVLADESYLRESILRPEAKIVDGWRPIMPTFQGQVSEYDLIALVSYLKSLRRGETPPRVEDSRPPDANPKTTAK